MRLNRACFRMAPGRWSPDTLYCGRRLGRAAILGSDSGQCGPHGGAQCADCKAGPAIEVPESVANASLAAAEAALAAAGLHHLGEWRFVNGGESTRSDGRGGPATRILLYCSNGSEGLACEHGAGVHASHWSCCGSLEQGSTVCPRRRS